MEEVEERIKVGVVVPPFRLPDASGRIVEREQYRGRAALIILFLPDLKSVALRYLQGLAQAMEQWPRDERAVVIAGASREELAAAPGLSIPLLADGEGRVRARYLPEGVAGGWFATDRYGELFAQGLVSSAAELPPPEELRGWLEFTGCLCDG